MKIKLLSIVLMLSLLVTLTGCTTNENTTSIKDTQFKFNTVMTITLYGYNDTAIFTDIWALFDQMENSYSANIQDSDVSRFNNSLTTEPVKMPADIVEMVAIAKTYSEKSNGAFDLTIEPIVKMWGISTETPRVPTQKEIDAALPHVNYKNVIADTKNNTLQKLDPNAHIDLGAIAKGYAADKCTAFLKEKGIDSAILNLGGNIYALGSKTKNDPWNVGIQSPVAGKTGELMGTVKATEKSIVTSGSYERFFVQDGVTYHHILNPSTGYPVDNTLISVTIISDLSVMGDILSTTTFALGLDEGRQLINTLDHTAAIFVTKNHDVYFAGDKTLLETFELSQNDFQLKE